MQEVEMPKSIASRAFGLRLQGIGLTEIARRLGLKSPLHASTLVRSEIDAMAPDRGAAGVRNLTQVALDAIEIASGLAAERTRLLGIVDRLLDPHLDPMTSPDARRRLERIARRAFNSSSDGAFAVCDWSGPPWDMKAMSIALVGPSFEYVRDVMVARIVKRSPSWHAPTLHMSKRRLVWPNDATAILYDNVDRLRGTQHHKAWAGDVEDEGVLAQLRVGLRLGDTPELVRTRDGRGR